MPYEPFLLGVGVVFHLLITMAHASELSVNLFFLQGTAKCHWTENYYISNLEAFLDVKITLLFLATNSQQLM